jgi:hypothetical protein
MGYLDAGMGYGVWGMEDEADPDELKWSWWDAIRMFYPYLSVLVFGPVCLAFGWHWAALAISAVGTLVVVKWHWYRSCSTLPLLAWNSAEGVLALFFIVRDFRDRVSPPGSTS